MLYFELGLGAEDYLTDRECNFPGKLRNLVWKFKAKFGIIVKKKVHEKTVFVIPNVKKKFLKKIDKIYRITGDKFFCISDELFYRDEFMNFIREKQITVIDGQWVIRFLLNNILNYIFCANKDNLLNKEIAFLVDSDYEIVLEYIKLFAPKVKLITIVTKNIKRFNKIEEKYLSSYGINLNIMNNYRKSLAKADIVVNFDFSEKEINKYDIYNRTYFINLFNKYEIKNKNFEGINITSLQISMPKKYLPYVELFYNFNYLSVYESFIKKKTSLMNIFKEIEKDDVEVIWLENEKGMIPKNDFLLDRKKILDK